MVVNNIVGYKVWIDNSIIRCRLQGKFKEDDAKKIIEEIKTHSKEIDGAKVLMDLRKIEGSTPGASRVLVDSVRAEPSIFEKLALSGKSVIGQVMANFIIRASEKEEKIRYFGDEEEALRWLSE